MEKLFIKYIVMRCTVFFESLDIWGPSAFGPFATNEEAERIMKEQMEEEAEKYKEELNPRLVWVENHEDLCGWMVGTVNYNNKIINRWTIQSINILENDVR